MINEEIRDKEVRLIDSDGPCWASCLSRMLRRLAANKNLDLVKIAPHAVPPVCKIMDYGKYMFEIAKRKRKRKRTKG
jgi:translation initiation factor IF-3